MNPINWPGLIGAGIATAAAAGALAWGVHSIHADGFASGENAAAARYTKQIADAHAERAKAFERAALAEREIRTIEASVDRRIASARQQGRDAVRTVKEASRADPNFARCARPADVRRVRDDQHRTIADAAARGAELSAAIVPGLRGTGPGDGE